MPIRACRETRCAGWSARWRTLSTRRASTATADASSRATRCCSHASRRRCRSATKARVTSASFPALAELIPYASAVSDVYQDLCGEGSYVGKGIYDVDAFEAALAGRVPENTLLSHDLFEGVFARAGLASDIELVDEYPARYAAARPRAHRWARGDWQLLPWVFGCGPGGIDRSRRVHPAARSLEDVRQPAPDARGAGELAHPAGRVDPAAAIRRDLDGVRASRCSQFRPCRRCWPVSFRVTAVSRCAAISGRSAPMRTRRDQDGAACCRCWRTRHG